MSKNRFGISQMNARVQSLEEMRSLFREAGGAMRPGETKSRWLERAAIKLGLSRGRAVSIEYRKGVVIHAHEIEMAKRRVAEQRHRELEVLRQQVAALEAQYRDDRDAFEARTRELVGGFIPLLEKLGVLETRGEAGTDGET